MQTLTRHRSLGLTDAEYEQICSLLNRAPNDVELAVFSLMWSEHCGYKHSKKLLRSLPTEADHLIVGPGENAGVVAVGENLACAFKVESHNHPSAVEPFEGAATGVGGILRDVFALGARPIALLNSLRFGTLESERSRYLLERAVAGIGHYGNSIGVATVGGEVAFDRSYENNCLINVMCVGLAKRDQLIRSAAAGPGNAVVLFGARTGRDGIGGASVLASAELDEQDHTKRPSVQIGDPFEEKKLLECSLDLLNRDLLVSLQDLGAAGLTSACSEMAAKGEVGIDLDVARVPLRQAGMEPFEIMVSESQERMVCVVAPEKVDDVLRVCTHWDVIATKIGEITDTRCFRIYRDKELLGDIPVRTLTDDCPLYDLESQQPTQPLYPAPTRVLDSDASQSDTLLALLKTPNIASKRWVFDQYDCLVRSHTVVRPGVADAAVLVLDPTLAYGPKSATTHAAQNRAVLPSQPATLDAPQPAIAMAIDGNGRRVACDPYVGTVEAVLECVSNLACVGAKPLGLTNCLNFGNPEKPHIAWQLECSISALGDACRSLNIPVVGGNVSLYNEGANGPIYPTPTVGLVGELPDARAVCGMGFKAEGDAIALIAPASWNPQLAGSELASLQGGTLPQSLPAVNSEEVAEIQRIVREGVRSAIFSSAHDVADGGLLVAIAESCIAGNLGAFVKVDLATNAFWFGEAVGAFLVSGEAEKLKSLGEHVRILGQVKGENLEVIWGEEHLRVSVDALREAHERAIPQLMNQK